jgi:hypothetical protein
MELYFKDGNSQGSTRQARTGALIGASRRVPRLRSKFEPSMRFNLRSNDKNGAVTLSNEERENPISL